MGYTTKFRGKFEFDKEPSVKLIKQMAELDDLDNCKTEYPEAFPGNYCQWVVNKQLDGIEWDGNEKFYDYAEWLQFIIDHVLKPAKLQIRGRVEFQGEEFGDYGLLIVEDDQHVRIEKLPLVSDDSKELVAFRDFVLSHRDSGDILRDWKRSKK